MTIASSIAADIAKGLASSIVGGVGGGISYLLRATFTAADQSFVDAQVLDTVAEGVEDGSLTVVDTSTGTLEILSNKMKAAGVAAWGSLGVYADSITKSLGLAYLGNVNVSVTGSDGVVFGLQADTTLTAWKHHTYFVNSDIKVRISIGDLAVGVFSLSTDYSFAIVMGGYNSSGVPYKTGDIKADFTYGVSHFIKGGAFTNWTLLYRIDNDATATLYPMLVSNDNTETIDDLKIPDVDLSALLIPNSLDTAVVTADTFTHIADCVIEAKVTTRPTSGNLDIEFRRQDNDNKWICRVTSAGAISLEEVVATVETTRVGPVASAVANGGRVIITAEDDAITIYSKEVRRGAYASATNFKTDTGGKIVFGSGAVGHLADWSRGNDAAYSSLDDF